MDTTQAHNLEQLLLSSGSNPLRLVFCDGETYDLTQFGVAKDDDEALPHATAEVVRRVKSAVEKATFFEPGAAMFFRFDEVASVEDVETGTILFSV
jgi:hypothetical protein